MIRGLRSTARSFWATGPAGMAGAGARELGAAAPDSRPVVLGRAGRARCPAAARPSPSRACSGRRRSCWPKSMPGWSAQNFGCAVEIVPGDLAATASSMGTNGQPAVAPELWITRVADVWNAALEGQTGPPGGAPPMRSRCSRAGSCPPTRPRRIPRSRPSRGSRRGLRILPVNGRPRFISCPPDWGCAVVNRNLLRAHGHGRAVRHRRAGQPVRARCADRRSGEPQGAAAVLLLAAQCDARRSSRFQPVDLGPFNKDNFLCLGRVACASPLPSGFACRSGHRRSGPVGLSRGAGRGGLFPARASCLSPR